MAAVFEETVGLRGVLYKLGLGQPIARAFVAAVVVGGVLYVAGQPKVAFREDGSMKPARLLSPAPDATHTHFLLAPVAAGAAAFLFT
tara:strand:- start:167 stop:427 length:261 start_codon:yes stop_codon:yes gene_type:complete